MTSNGDAVNDHHNEEDAGVKLRDLQGLLRKSMGNELTVVDYSTDYLVAKGENYSSLILKVDAVVQRTKDSPEEKLSLVAKTITDNDYNREHMDNDILFGREIFFFEKLMPAFLELEREAGVEEKDLINVTPLYYGGRLSLNEDCVKRAGSDTVILMENLKVQGFRTMDRIKGFNLENAKLVMEKIAHYHALGIVLKHRNPKIFEEAREIMKKIPYFNSAKEVSEYKSSIINLACKDSRIAKYKDRMEQSIRRQTDFFPASSDECNEVWIGITFGDLWLNNILVHAFDENDAIADDLRFVDMQLTQIYSPMLDLPYFLFCSCQAEVVENNFDELLDIHYENFIERMNKINFDTTPFTKKSFHDELNRIGKERILQCLTALKFFTIEKSEDKGQSEIESVMRVDKASTDFYERAWVGVSKFAEKGWI